MALLRKTRNFQQNAKLTEAIDQNSKPTQATVDAYSVTLN